MTRVGGVLTNVVVARVEAVEKHPNADKLRVITDAGLPLEGARIVVSVSAFSSLNGLPEDGVGAPLHARDDGRGHLSSGGTGFNRARKLRP